MRVKTPFLRTVQCARKHVFECSQEELEAMEDAGFSLRHALLIACNEHKLPEVPCDDCPECQKNRDRYHFDRAKTSAQ